MWTELCFSHSRCVPLLLIATHLSCLGCAQSRLKSCSFPIPLLSVSCCICPLYASTSAVMLSDIKLRHRVEGASGVMQEGCAVP